MTTIYGGYIQLLNLIQPRFKVGCEVGLKNSPQRYTSYMKRPLSVNNLNCLLIQPSNLNLMWRLLRYDKCHVRTSYMYLIVLRKGWTGWIKVKISREKKSRKMTRLD